VLVASNFLVPNATFVVELIAFLLVLGVLARYVLPPVNNAIRARQEVIRQSLADAETAKTKAQQAEDEYKQTLEKARTDARAIVDEANKAAEALRSGGRERGEQEYARIVAQAQPDLEASARRAAEDIRRDVSGLVIAVVEKVIGEGFDANAHRDLIDRTIGIVEAEAAPARQVSA
jgi:F-type H+-transporting ATPase subunit b